MSIYAVNGKTPIAAWIPSRDTAGNGTTTLTDLVGSNNGTLTNMDAATDWVADTGAGGVRALDFDGVNDHIVVPQTASIFRPFAASLWIKCGSQPDAFSNYLLGWHANTASIGWALAILGSTGTARIWDGLVWRAGVADLTNNAWRHLVLSVESGGAAKLYVDGVQDWTATISADDANTQSCAIGARRDGEVNYVGRLDDLRTFSQVLTADDVAFLYSSGNGRGRLSGTIQTRRRRSSGGYGL